MFKRLSIFAALLLALGCQAPAAAPAPREQQRHPEPASVLVFRDKPLRLEQSAAKCEVVYPEGAPDAQRLTLDLAPPCHVMVWREAPEARASAEGQSDGVPVGRIGEPEAWLYRSAKNATVIAVIGDLVHADRVARGYHCGGSVQGVLFRQDRMALGVKRANIGHTCVEVGMDEKGFWLLAHASPAVEDAQLFDEIVRAEVLFPDAAQRSLYKELPVQSIRGDRVYSFELEPRPGMQPGRHFHIVSVAVARVGARVAVPAGLTYGPNGGSWEKLVRTADGRYDIRLTEGMLLPNGVKTPDLDLDRAAGAISTRYGELTTNR